MLKAALAYPSIGLAVFGVGADCRTPFKQGGRFEHGCHSATRECDEIAYRWGQVHPRANIAVACGDYSGVLVLDVDCKGDKDGREDLAELQRMFEPLPRSWLTATPSGGEHHWFRQPRGLDLVNRVGLPVPLHSGGEHRLTGIDIRTTGGSVAVPPSSKNGRPYTWVNKPSQTELADAPDWLLMLCSRPPPPPPGEPLRFPTHERLGRYVAKAINDELSTVASMKRDSGRNHRLFIAAANVGSFVGADLLRESEAISALEKAAAACGLTGEDGLKAVQATIQSGLNRGMAQPRRVTL